MTARQNEFLRQHRGRGLRPACRRGAIWFLLPALLMLAGCHPRNPASGSSSSPPSSASADGTQTASSAEEIDITFTARDKEVGYDESASTQLTLGGKEILVTGKGASASGSTLTISAEGTYVLTGTLDDGRIVVDAADTDKIQIVFKGVTIACGNNAPLFIKKADKVFLTLAEGTNNTLKDGGEYALSDDDSNVDGVIFSRADLTLSGSGSLTIQANYKHGIVSKDDLVITGGVFRITAAKVGLNGKDCVKIGGGDFTIQSGSDGIRSGDAEEANKGFTYIDGGTFAITAQTDGIQAETVLRIDDGKFNLTTGGGSANASTIQGGNPAGGWGHWGASSSDSDSSSAKGMKAGGELVVNGGAITIDSSDDSLHGNGNLTIAGGDFLLTSGDDGIHADGDTTVSGGTIVIGKSYEGVEGKNVTISGGTIRLTASDDGINAAGGSDGSSLGGRPGQNAFRAGSDSSIRIIGGVIDIDASGDGIDSNGGLYVEGGTITVSGPTSNGNGALDYDGEGRISGGTVVAAGSSGMMQGFGSSSSQCSLTYVWTSAQSAGAAVTLTDSSGKTVAAYTPSKAYQSVIISAPALQQGETYTLTVGGQSTEVTLTSIVTSVGGQGGQTPDRPGGNRGGGFGRR